MGARVQVRSRFTLIELAIVVAIIALLAAIAVPMLMSMRYRAQQAELHPNLDAIQIGEQEYDRVHGDYYVVTSDWPTQYSLDAHGQWVLGPGSELEQIGWQPDGHTYAQYGLFSGGGTCPDEVHYTIPGDDETTYNGGAWLDLDHDGQAQVYLCCFLGAMDPSMAWGYPATDGACRWVEDPHTVY